MLHASDGFGLKGWMVTELHLKGAELITFALVHQFAQSGAGIYKGNTTYLSEWTGWSEPTCRKHLAALVGKGLLSEVRGRENNSPFCHHKLAPDFYEKHPQISLVSPPKNLRTTPKILDGSTPKNFRGEYNNNGNINRESNTPLPPTLQEVEDYARSKGFADPRGFAEYYIAYQTENGWMTGKGKNRKPIENWKLNVLSWSPNHKTQVFQKSSRRTAEMPLEHFNSIFQ